MVRRRAVLGSVVTTAAVALAGCLGSSDGGESRIDGDPTITVRSRSCGNPSGDRALPRWSPEPRRILVEGTILGTDRCTTARLAGTSHDAGADALTVRVETTDDPDAEDCRDCLTEISYLAAVPFAGGLPSSVTVVHRGARNSETTITRKDG